MSHVSIIRSNTGSSVSSDASAHSEHEDRHAQEATTLHQATGHNGTRTFAIAEGGHHDGQPASQSHRSGVYALPLETPVSSPRPSSSTDPSHAAPATPKHWNNVVFNVAAPERSSTHRLQDGGATQTRPQVAQRVEPAAQPAHGTSRSADAHMPTLKEPQLTQNPSLPSELDPAGLRSRETPNVPSEVHSTQELRDEHAAQRSVETSQATKAGETSAQRHEIPPSIMSSSTTSEPNASTHPLDPTPPRALPAAHPRAREQSHHPEQGAGHPQDRRSNRVNGMDAEIPQPPLPNPTHTAETLSSVASYSHNVDAPTIHPGIPALNPTQPQNSDNALDSPVTSESAHVQPANPNDAPPPYSASAQAIQDTARRRIVDQENQPSEGGGFWSKIFPCCC